MSDVFLDPLSSRDLLLLIGALLTIIYNMFNKSLAAQLNAIMIQVEAIKKDNKEDIDRLRENLRREIETLSKQISKSQEISSKSMEDYEKHIINNVKNVGNLIIEQISQKQREVEEGVAGVGKKYLTLIKDSDNKNYL